MYPLSSEPRGKRNRNITTSAPLASPSETDQSTSCFCFIELTTS